MLEMSRGLLQAPSSHTGAILSQNPKRRPLIRACLSAPLAAILSLPAAALSQQIPDQQVSADFDSLAASAAAARQQGDTASATRLYAQAVEANPQWPDGWWFLGVLQYGANQFAPARDALTHFLELKPNGAPALALRGLCEFETGQLDEALADIQRGIALGAAAQPRNAEILLYHEALLLARLGSFEQALGKYTSFVKQGKTNPELLTAIGLAGLRMPVLPQDADPAQSDLIAMTGAAASKVMAGDKDGGQQAFQALFAKYPNTPNLHYLYGYLLFARQPDAAIDQFQQELTVAPRNPLDLAMLAWTYGIEGDYAKALPFAQKAVEQDPSLPTAQLILGKALVETEDTAAALPHLEKALQMEPGNLEGHVTLAKAYSRLGRKQDASRERALCLELSAGGAPPSANP